MSPLCSVSGHVCLNGGVPGPASRSVERQREEILSLSLLLGDALKSPVSLTEHSISEDSNS